MSTESKSASSPPLRGGKDVAADSTPPQSSSSSSVSSTTAPQSSKEHNNSSLAEKVQQTSIRDLLASVDETGKNVLPLLTELADKQQQSSVLVQRAVLLFGLADRFKDTERGLELKEDAERLLSYAEEVQKSEETSKVLQHAQAFIDSVSDKYERHGKDLFKQSQELWDEVMSSGEAEEFLSAGSDVIADWKRYGGSAQGQALINSLSGFVRETVESKGIQLLDLVTEYSQDASSFQDNAKRHKAMLRKAAKGMKQIIDEDDELKEWVDKGAELLKEKVSGAQEVISTVVESEDAGADILLSDDTLAQASQKGQEALTKLKESAIGQDLLRKGTQVLTELQTSEQFRPEALVETAQRLTNDPQARQELVTKVKDAALEFLLQYLPTVQVPPLEAEDETKQISLRNIDLSGFKVTSKDVDVTLLDQGIHIGAKNIVCDMKNLAWSFKSKSFPYLSTGGTADCQAYSVSFSLNLELIKKPKATLSNPQQQEQQPQQQRRPNRQPQSQQSQAHTQSPTHSQPQLQPQPQPQPQPQEAEESKSKVVETLDEIFDSEYELILAKGRRRKGFVVMPELSVVIADSWFSSLYNMLLGWFSNEVRKYVEYQVNTIIEAKSSILLGTVNRYAHEYLPVLARVKDKVKEKAPQIAQVVKSAAAASPEDSTDAESVDGDDQEDKEQE